MKKIVILLLLAIVGCKSVHTLKSSLKLDDNINPVKMQNDSIHYLQTDIVGNKNKYIGKPLKKLLNDLKFDVKFVIISSNRPMEGNYFDPKNEKIDGIALVFITQRQYNNLNARVDAVRLQVLFQPEKQPPYAEAVALYKKYGNDWSQEIRAYYGKQIVKDVVVPGLLLK